MAIENENEGSAPNTSRRESLAAAMASLESGEGEQAEIEAPLEHEEAEAPVAAAEPTEETAEEKTARERDEHGRFKGKEGEEPAPKPKAEAKPKGEEKPAAEAAPVEQKPAVPAVRPPQAWKPVVRELAAKLPPEFRPILEEANRRERDASLLAQQNAQLRQAAEQLKQTGNPYREAIEPFENSIRQRGGEPRQFVASLLQTEHALSTAQPGQRAQLLARLVLQYGQDVLRPDRQDENGMQSSPLDRELVALMSGRAPVAAPTQSQPSPQQFRDPRLDALIEQGQRRQQEAQAAAQSEAEETASTFAESHEFYADVAPHVADILDVWAKQGKREVTDDDLERAYHLACQLDPNVAVVYDQRRAAEAAEKARASTRRSRAAGSSVRSTPAPAAAEADGKPLSRRESMRRAMEAQDSQGRV